MLKNYLKIAFRNLWKNKTFSLINIAGLAIGLCCFLLIAIYVMDELSFDRHNKHAERIYRVHADIRFGGNDLRLPQTSDMMGPMLRKDYPQVEEYTRIYSNSGSKLLKKGNGYIKEDKLAHVDSTFFDVFTAEPISGDLKYALNEPNTVVLTATAAIKYFGTVECLGKFIETREFSGKPYKVTAVIKDFPSNSHFDLQLLFPMKNVQYDWGQFVSHNFFTYLLLKEGADPAALEAKFGEYVDRYVLPQAKQFMQIGSMAEFEKAGNKLKYSMMKLTDLHLRSDRSFELSAPGNIQYIYIFSAVALAILLIACINFMNLTTARSAGRAREVGIRKVLGTERRNLVLQFLSESTLMTVISFILALGLLYAVMPFFNDLAGKTMKVGQLSSPWLLLMLVLLPFAVGLLAGCYPAFYLSSFKPIAVLKGKFSAGKAASGFRSTLVVVQFFTSIILIIATIVIYRQLDYIRSTNPGFERDQVMVVNDTYLLGSKAETFRNEVRALPGVLSGTLSSFLPVSNSARNDNSYSKEAVMDVNSGFNMQAWFVDQDYLSTMGMKLLKGRNFSSAFGSDSTAIIINETAAKFLDYKDPVGQRIYKHEGDGTVRSFTIVGVIRDFNYESMRQPVRPLALFFGASTGLASFKVKTADLPALLRQVEGKWRSMTTGLPFSYSFLDESFDSMYRSERRVGRIALVFSMLAIFIACLGLFGLAAFVAEQRTKEIGIRKVLGANVRGIVQLISKDFIKLVLISFVFAAPLAWWAMHKWLEDFAFRTSISWWIFLLAGAIALLIALATVSVQSVRAAFANPVDNLRNE
ncbi:MAG TPA: ABC transporter permease [Flavisolibacter sp.]|nr:ABC transporter permease [Flavisolibacter sp.]